jgi:hypothetical protein
MVSQLLYHLPSTEQYRILFMQRELDEVLLSQEKMLQRRAATAAPREKMKEAFTLHLETLFDWLHEQQNMSILVVNYNQLVGAPTARAEQINAFLGSRLTVEDMVQTVDPSLYRNRASETQAHAVG